MDWPSQPSIQIYPLDKYSFTNDPAMPIPQIPDEATLIQEYREYGMRRSLRLVLVAHAHSHPHVLLFQHPDGSVTLPGDAIRPAEGDSDALQRMMRDNLAHPDPQYRWQADECLASWWRPDNHQINRTHPYLPAHHSQPKEQIRIMMVRMPSGVAFRMPMSRKLLAVPLCDLRAGEVRFGELIASLPHLLSRYHFINISQ